MGYGCASVLAHVSALTANLWSCRKRAWTVPGPPYPGSTAVFRAWAPWETKREAGPDFKTEVEQIAYDLRQSMIAAMSEDLKIPVMVSGLLSGIKQINRLLSGQKMDVDSASRLLGCFKDLDRILHLFDFNKKTEYSPEVQALLEERDAARRKKDWNTSDRLRRQIEKMGVPVHDKKV